MNIALLSSFIISLIFFIIKFLEMRFINKENKPLKTLIMDTLIVFISCTATLLILEQFNLEEMFDSMKANAPVFVNKADF